MSGRHHRSGLHGSRTPGIGVVLLVFSGRKTLDYPYILMVRCTAGGTEEQVQAFVASQVKRMSLKSKMVEKGITELNYEVRLKEDSSLFVNELEQMEGVGQVALVSYNGDYMG